MHVFASATTNTLLRVEQTPKNKKTKKINKSEKNHHFVLAISTIYHRPFFHLN
jgi:hypothetical protein